MKPCEKRAFYEIEAPGVRCRLCALGASIASVEVPDARGRFANIALSPNNFRDGSADASLAGRTIGPCCGRVRGGEIEIDGRGFLLDRNEGANHLHGGRESCATQLWEGTQLTPARVRFELRLPDGQAGYPGNRTLWAEYEAFESGLRVRYGAQTDAPTWIELTNHVYWDLSGRFDGSAMEQTLQVAADRAVRNDGAHLPVSIEPVDGGAFDFRAPASPAQMLRAYPDEQQLAIGRGYNNALLLSAELQRALGFSARLTSPDGALRMTLRTDAPAIVFYSGGFLDASTRLDGGGATPGCALALEAQGAPDPYHLPGATPAILRPGETWRREITWSFDRGDAL